jgi:hypothetical protein
MMVINAVEKKSLNNSSEQIKPRSGPPNPVQQEQPTIEPMPIVAEPTLIKKGWDHRTSNKSFDSTPS